MPLHFSYGCFESLHYIKNNCNLFSFIESWPAPYAEPDLACEPQVEYHYYRPLMNYMEVNK